MIDASISVTIAQETEGCTVDEALLSQENCRVTFLGHGQNPRYYLSRKKTIMASPQLCQQNNPASSKLPLLLLSASASLYADTALLLPFEHTHLYMYVYVYMYVCVFTYIYPYMYVCLCVYTSASCLPLLLSNGCISISNVLNTTIMS